MSKEKDLSLSTKILEKHYHGMVNASQFIDLMFEEVSVLKTKKHIDDPQVLSLTLEFFNPFKKKQADDGDSMASKMLSNSDRSKKLLKTIKDAVANATKASKELKSVDLTSIEDVKNKVGALVNGVMKVGELQMGVANDTSLEPEELDAVLDPVKGAIDSLYMLAAYNLNVTKTLIDKHVKELERVVPPGVLRNAVVAKKQPAVPSVAKTADPEMDAMRKSIMTPWAKHLGGMAMAGLDQGKAMGSPGSMRLREEEENQEETEQLPTDEKKKI